MLGTVGVHCGLALTKDFVATILDSLSTETGEGGFPHDLRSDVGEGSAHIERLLRDHDLTVGMFGPRCEGGREGPPVLVLPLGRTEVFWRFDVVPVVKVDTDPVEVGELVRINVIHGPTHRPVVNIVVGADDFTDGGIVSSKLIQQEVDARFLLWIEAFDVGFEVFERGLGGDLNGVTTEEELTESATEWKVLVLFFHRAIGWTKSKSVSILKHYLSGIDSQCLTQFLQTV